MKKPRTRRPTDDVDRDTMRPEYDFSNGKRGVTAKRYAQGTNIVRIDPDVMVSSRTRQRSTRRSEQWPEFCVLRAARENEGAARLPPLPQRGRPVLHDDERRRALRAFGLVGHHDQEAVPVRTHVERVRPAEW